MEYLSSLEKNPTTVPAGPAIPTGRADEPMAQFLSHLDRLHAAFCRGEPAYPIMAELVETAAAALARGGQDILARLREAASHPVSRFVFECPFTRHSFEKPRGYAGDAGLIDFIYGHRDAQDSVARLSATGSAILAHNLDSPAPAAVRARRNITARMIEDAVRRVGRPRVLSVACGHARELELANPAALGRVDVLHGFDQDEQSLAVAQQYKVGSGHLVPHQGTIIDLLRDSSLTDYDLIYAAGLFDYLSDRLARRLTKNLLARLRKGGRLLVANFLPGIRDSGYMTAFMDWTLIYRDRAEILGFAGDVDAKEIAHLNYFMEPNRNIGFLEITRA